MDDHAGIGRSYNGSTRDTSCGTNLLSPIVQREGGVAGVGRSIARLRVGDDAPDAAGRERTPLSISLSYDATIR